MDKSLCWAVTPRDLRSVVQKLAFLFILAAAPLLLSDCKKQPEINIPFETIGKGDDALLRNEKGEYASAHHESLGLFIITDMDGVRQFQEIVSSCCLDYLADVDYDEYIVAFATLGKKPMADFEITITKISRVGNTVDLWITTKAPTIGNSTFTYPYHAIKIRRENLPIEGNPVFRMWEGEQLILDRAVVLP